MRSPLENCPPERLCAVCAYSLDYLEGQGYLHLGPVAAMHDHVPMPVDPAEMGWNPAWVCDFCGGTPAPWMVLSEDFVVHNAELVVSVTHGKVHVQPIEAVMQGDWTACPRCVAFVKGGQWQELIERVSIIQPNLSDKVLRKLYAGLSVHITGFALRSDGQA